MAVQVLLPTSVGGWTGTNVAGGLSALDSIRDRANDSTHLIQHRNQASSTANLSFESFTLPPGSVTTGVRGRFRLRSDHFPQTNSVTLNLFGITAPGLTTLAAIGPVSVGFGGTNYSQFYNYGFPSGFSSAPNLTQAQVNGLGWSFNTTHPTSANGVHFAGVWLELEYTLPPTPPTAPTLIVPSDLAEFPAANPLLYDWGFNDPTAGATQSEFALVRRKVAP